MLSKSQRKLGMGEKIVEMIYRTLTDHRITGKHNLILGPSSNTTLFIWGKITTHQVGLLGSVSGKPVLLSLVDLFSTENSLGILSRNMVTKLVERLGDWNSGVSISSIL